MFADSNAGRSLQDRPVKAGALTERLVQIWFLFQSSFFREGKPYPATKP